jgi:N-acetyl-gamma-glutamyl-phosphate reductase
MPSSKLRVAICGASGYTGAELLRILSGHDLVEVTAVTSEKSRGKTPAELFPHLTGYEEIVYEPLEPEKLLDKADLFFMALPHRTAQPAVALFFKSGKRVIDLSADYRLRDAAIYEEWYKTPHYEKEVLKSAVYGLPELHRAKIRKARLVANPGCYPTAAILGIYPAVRAGLASQEGIVIDCKSGTSGAGKQSDVRFSFCEVNEGFMAYSVASHRHTPEIEQEISLVAGEQIRVNFTPHLLPVDRGILGTIYMRLKKKTSDEEMLKLYGKTYRSEPFVRVLDAGRLPNIKAVRGTNRCDVGLKVDERTNTLIVVTAIDNLVKGASGQAVHNMNIMTGFPEDAGLAHLALFP